MRHASTAAPAWSACRRIAWHASQLRLSLLLHLHHDRSPSIQREIPESRALSKRCKRRIERDGSSKQYKCVQRDHRRIQHADIMQNVDCVAAAPGHLIIRAELMTWRGTARCSGRPGFLPQPTTRCTVTRARIRCLRSSTTCSAHFCTVSLPAAARFAALASLQPDPGTFETYISICSACCGRGAWLSRQIACSFVSQRTQRPGRPQGRCFGCHQLFSPDRV